MSLSYRNQSIDLSCKSIDWFLYDRDIDRKVLKRDGAYILVKFSQELVSAKEIVLQLLSLNA